MVKVVVMAGGEGTRLRPLTLTRPKPMCMILDKPIIQHTIESLSKQGFKEFIITIGYKGDMIKEHLGDGSKLGVKITYSIEEEPMGTVGGVKLVEDQLDETFVVVSGDIYTTWDVKKQLEFHREHGGEATLGLLQVPDPRHFGVAVLDGDRISQFVEKPQEPISNLINNGIYILEPSTLKLVPPGEKYDFSRNLFPQILPKGIYGNVQDETWIDIGLPGNYLKALKEAIRIHTGNSKNIWVSPNAKVSEGATLKGPLMICNGTTIGPKCVLSKSIIYPNTTIQENVKIEASLIGENVTIGPNSIISKAVIGDNTHIGENSQIIAQDSSDPEKIMPNSII